MQAVMDLLDTESFTEPDAASLAAIDAYDGDDHTPVIHGTTVAASSHVVKIIAAASAAMASGSALQPAATCLQWAAQSSKGARCVDTDCRRAMRWLQRQGEQASSAPVIAPMLPADATAASEQAVALWTTLERACGPAAWAAPPLAPAQEGPIDLGPAPGDTRHTSAVLGAGARARAVACTAVAAAASAAAEGSLRTQLLASAGLRSTAAALSASFSTDRLGPSCSLGSLGRQAWDFRRPFFQGKKASYGVTSAFFHLSTGWWDLRPVAGTGLRALWGSLALGAVCRHMGAFLGRLQPGRARSPQAVGDACYLAAGAVWWLDRIALQCDAALGGGGRGAPSGGGAASGATGRMEAGASKGDGTAGGLVGDAREALIAARSELVRALWVCGILLGPLDSVTSALREARGEEASNPEGADQADAVCKAAREAFGLLKPSLDDGDSSVTEPSGASSGDAAAAANGGDSSGAPILWDQWQGRVVPYDLEHKQMVQADRAEGVLGAVLALRPVPLRGAALAVLAARRHEMCAWDYPKLKADAGQCDALVEAVGGLRTASPGTGAGAST